MAPVDLTSHFSTQLPYRTGPQTSHARQMVEQNKECLIQISKYKFSLVISGLTKILQRVNESVRSPSFLSPMWPDLIVLFTLRERTDRITRRITMNRC